MMVRKKELAVFAVAAVLVVAVVGAYAFDQSQLQGTKHAFDDQVAGYSIVAGNGTASDGRLRIAVHGYRFDAGGSILFQSAPGFNATGCSTTIGGICYTYGAGVGSSQPFLLVNATVTNTGGSDTSIGGGFSAEITDGQVSYENGIYGANAAFPGEYPNYSLPLASGGYNLSPGRSITCWFLFVILYHANSQGASGMTLKQFMFTENSYGGIYDGNGGYSCTDSAHPCEKPMVEFILTPPWSSSD